MNAAAYALPEFEAYEWIASIYDAQAKDKEYIQTYADWLEERSHGLEHATAAMRISDRFCRQERWRRAALCFESRRVLLGLGPAKRGLCP